MANPYRDGDLTLGELVSVHARRRGGVLYAVFGAMALAVGVWFAVTGAALWLGVAIAAGAVGATLVLRRMAEREDGETIALHERGLSVHASTGDRVVPFRDVVSVTSSARRARGSAVETQRHVIELVAGEPVVFTHLYDDAAGLLAAIHAATRERLKTEALRALDETGSVRFGFVSISRHGIRRGERAPHRWSEIDRAEITPLGLAVGPDWSRLEVWKRRHEKPTLSVPTDRVPNAELLVAVVRILVARAGATSAPRSDAASTGLSSPPP